MGQRRAGRGVELVGLGVALGKDKAADRQHRRRFVRDKLRRGRGRQRQGTALWQLPQRQRRGRLPAGQGQRVLGSQGVGVQKAEKARQFLPGVLPRFPAGQRTAEHRRPAAQLQHRGAGQQVERPSAGRVVAEQVQVRAEGGFKIGLAGQAAEVFGFIFRSGDGLNHRGTFSSVGFGQWAGG